MKGRFVEECKRGMRKRVGEKNEKQPKGLMEREKRCYKEEGEE